MIQKLVSFLEICNCWLTNKTQCLVPDSRKILTSDWPPFLVSLQSTKAAQCRRSRPAMTTLSRSTQQERVSFPYCKLTVKHSMQFDGWAKVWRGRSVLIIAIITHQSIYNRLFSGIRFIDIVAADRPPHFFWCFILLTFTSAFWHELMICTPSSSNMFDRGDVIELSSGKPSWFFSPHDTWRYQYHLQIVKNSLILRDQVTAGCE